jgi:Pheromone A receptor
VFVAYIVQIHRYGIYEGFGCRIAVHDTAVSVVLIPVPRLVISLVSGLYGCKDTSAAPELQSDWIILRREYVSHLDQRTTSQVDCNLFYWKLWL